MGSGEHVSSSLRRCRHDRAELRFAPIRDPIPITVLAMVRAAFPHRRARRARGVLALVCVLVLGLLLTACGGKNQDVAPSVNTLPTASPSPTASPVTVTGLPDAAKLQVSDGESGTPPGGGLDFVSPVYTIGPSGPLPTVAKISIELDHALPRNTDLVVATREALSDSWTWLPATLERRPEARGVHDQAPQPVRGALGRHPGADLQLQAAGAGGTRERRQQGRAEADLHDARSWPASTATR